jgi:hypothetical protein
MGLRGLVVGRRRGNSGNSFDNPARIKVNSARVRTIIPQVFPLFQEGSSLEVDCIENQLLSSAKIFG